MQRSRHRPHWARRPRHTLDRVSWASWLFRSFLISLCATIGFLSLYAADAAGVNLSRSRCCYGCFDVSLSRLLGLADERLLMRHGNDPSLQRLGVLPREGGLGRSEEHTSELQSLMRISYAVFCLKTKK